MKVVQMQKVDHYPANIARSDPSKCSRLPVALYSACNKQRIQRREKSYACPVYAQATSFDYLLKAGISAAAVAKATQRFPALLSVDVHTRLQPNIRLLRTIGLTVEDIQSIIVRCPSVVSLDVDGKIKPVLEFLEEIGLDSEGQSSVIRRFPAVLTYGVKGHLKPHVAYLKSLGVDGTILPSLILARPSILGAGIEILVDHLLKKGFQRKQIRSVLRTYPFMYRIPVVDASGQVGEAAPDLD